MSGYASNTSVSEDRSRIEIERLLMRYGADEFGYMTRKNEAIIMFVFKGLHIEMKVPLPNQDDEKFCTTPTGRKTRSEDAAFREWEKEIRRRWRSLCLVIKALLVGIDDGVLTFEQAFMSYMVWGNGLTTSQLLLPTIHHALETGKGLGSVKQLEVLPEK